MGPEILSGKIESISLLRIIGELGVAISHTEFLRGEAINFSSGVYVFFAITGFLTMYTTQKYPQKKFLLRRIIRVIPVYWIITIATFLGINILNIDLLYILVFHYFYV